MALKVGMYERGYAGIRERLDALGLDIEVLTFDSDGMFAIDGGRVPASEVDVDYLWLSPEISADKIQAPAFEVAATLRSVDVVQTFNAGLDHPAYKRIAARGVKICNSSAQAVAISEFCFAHTLAHYHPLAERAANQESRTWAVTRFREIAKTNWLIVGYGPIGRALAKRAKAFEASVTVVRRSPETNADVDRAGTLDDLARFAAEADVIIAACPLNAETRGAIGADVFAATKPDALLINIARGPVVDAQAMIAALDGGRLGAAVLDVTDVEPLPTDDPLWAHPKVVLTCHTSFAGSGGFGRWQQLFLDNIVRFANGEPLENVVAPDDI
jgi:phosphoglycerate dehydrogenase-like enzyme